MANPHRGHSTTSSLNPAVFVPQESKPLSLIGSRPVSQSVLSLLLLHLLSYSCCFLFPLFEPCLVSRQFWRLLLFCVAVQSHDFVFCKCLRESSLELCHKLAPEYVPALKIV